MSPPTSTTETTTPVEGYSYWDSHSKFPAMDWQYEVANDDTRLSYWQWVRAKLSEDTDA